MFTFLVFLHVATAILFLGAVMFGTSAFPKAALSAVHGEQSAKGVARIAHRVTVLYGYLSALVPLFGVTLMLTHWSYFKTQPQFHAALLLAAIAWVLLLFVIIPKQKQLAALAGLLAPGEGDEPNTTADPVKLKKVLAITSGIFNLLWLITLLLMYI